jgi:hypothetical protein
MSKRWARPINRPFTLWGEAKSLHWTNDGFSIQGWLLYPAAFDANQKYPLVVAVHSGPASSLKPAWPQPGFNPVLLSQQGYFVLMPNPRGSYGQGEKFASANVRDFGGGDLREILAGVDEAIRTAPIDPERIGITGWSYGGFMTMFAVTRTARFKAAVAGAGLSNWQSYLRRKRHRHLDDPLFRSVGLRRPRGLRQDVRHQLHQAGEDSHPDRGGGSRRRMPRSAVLRILARAQGGGRENPNGGLPQRRPRFPYTRPSEGRAAAHDRLVQR